MNHRRVISILGLILFVLAAAQALPLIYCLRPWDPASATGFLLSGLGCATLGLIFRRIGHDTGELYRREGALIVIGAWLLASLTGAVPYVLSDAIPNVIDALFESTSGFTTTGASILTEVESLPRAALFWRSLTQWLGGIGIIVIFVALLSDLGSGARFLLKLEVPGPKSELLHARVKETAVALFRVYLVLTAAQCVLMILFGASVYDAVVHSFSTISTGGFSPHSESVGYFSTTLQVIVLVFMLAAGVNFSLHYLLFSRRDFTSLRDVELRLYLCVAGACSALVSFDLLAHGSEAARGVGEVALCGAFQVVSLLTTTGFATADFQEWPGLSRAVLVALMFGGACAGSTAGGAKLVRLILGWKVAMREVRLTVSPNSVIAVTIGGRAVPEQSLRGVVVLLLLWVFAWGMGAILLSVGDTGIVTAATASIATLSNIGPGLAAVGPMGNFALFAAWQKVLMLFLMLLGRLEFFAVLVLLQPSYWRR